jgi:hypothetical protein
MTGIVEIFLREILEIAAQELESHSLSINLPGRPYSDPTKHWNGRTPSLHRVLKKKSGDHGRNNKSSPIPQGAGEQTDQCDKGCISFEDAFDVPFVFQVAQSPTDFIRSLGEIFRNSLLGLPSNTQVIFSGCLPRDHVGPHRISLSEPDGTGNSLDFTGSSILRIASATPFDVTWAAMLSPTLTRFWNYPDMTLCAVGLHDPIRFFDLDNLPRHILTRR